MTELNYDLISEELKRKAVDACLQYLDSGSLETFNVDAKAASSVYATAIQIKDTQQTKKPVDMEPLIGSGILCESSQFDGFEVKYLGFLEAIENFGRAPYYHFSGIPPKEYCRPLYGHWHSAKNFDDVEGLIAKLKDGGFRVAVVRDEFKCIEHFCITGMQPDFYEPWGGYEL